MQSKRKTAVATVISSAALLAGGVLGASPAHALSSYTVTGSTLSSCQSQLNYAIKDLRASGQYHHSEPCIKLPTHNNGRYVYQGEVWYGR